MFKMRGKVFVGLSGGVDSAVVAALLKKEGHDVTCAFIRISIDGYLCSAGEDKVEAMRAAAHLGLPFVEVDLSEEYRARVLEESLREFAQGRTPNPDALCNREIKFGLFFDWCMAHGADWVATGHYARVAPQNPSFKKSLAPKFASQISARPRLDFFQEDFALLYAAADKKKDQSYFLWAVPREKLSRTLFPVGHLQKPQVRALAHKLGLPNADRKDSQGLCFLGPISMGEVLRRELSVAPGKVLDESGTVVGGHDGAALYTLGQRHGFELFPRQPHTKPHFVIAKDPARNTLTVSASRAPAPGETRLELSDVNWIGPAPDGEYVARYRYRQKLILARKEGTTVVLREPHYAPVGQSLVLYDGERCLGGGVIAHSALARVDK